MPGQVQPRRSLDCMRRQTCCVLHRVVWKPEQLPRLFLAVPCYTCIVVVGVQDLGTYHESLPASAGKQAIYQVVMALCQKGDEVIVPAPYWTSYPEARLLISDRKVPKILRPACRNDG